MAAIKEEKTVKFLFGSCLYTLVINLNIEWQMALLAIKTNIDIMDEIILLMALHWIENFTLCNTYL